jgi:hypothetical protein
LFLQVALFLQHYIWGLEVYHAASRGTRESEIEIEREREKERERERKRESEIEIER